MPLLFLINSVLHSEAFHTYFLLPQFPSHVREETFSAAEEAASAASFEFL
jgi:hypothetical protein